MLYKNLRLSNESVGAQVVVHSCVCVLRHIQDPKSDLRSQIFRSYSQLKDLTDRVYFSECSLH